MRKLLRQVLTLLLCVLLTLLMLTACGLIEEKEPTQPGTTQPDDEKNGSTAPAAPAEPAAPAAPAEPTVLPSGVVVKTDYSALGDYDAGEELFTRLNEEFTEKLLPRDDYGMLYPFVGDLLNIDTFGHNYEMGVHYGLADAHGRIVVDPVYTSVRQVSDGESGELIPFYILTRPNEELTPESEGFFNEPGIVTLAATDGSWVCDTEYTSIRYSDGYFICTRNAKRNMIDIRDSEGRFVTNSESFAFFPELSEYMINSLQVTEGMLLFPKGSYDAYYFAALDGSILLGPYAYATPYSEGLAAVRDAQSKLFGFIDTEGNWVIEPAFEYVHTFDGGYTCVTYPGGGGAVIDREGKIMISSDTAEFYKASQGWTGWDFSLSPESCASYYTDDFELYGSYSSVEVCGDWLLTGQTDERYKLINTVSGETLEGEGYGYTLFSDSFEKTQYIVLNLPSEDGTSYSSALFHPEHGIILEGDGFNIFSDGLTGSTYVAMYTRRNGSGDPNYNLYSADGKLLAEGIDKIYMITDGFLVMRDGFFSGLRSLDGEWHIRVNITEEFAD